jgi:hypothetical protein
MFDGLPRDADASLDILVNRVAKSVHLYTHSAIAIVVEMPTATPHVDAPPLADKGYGKDQSQASTFHPDHHLAFQPPESILSMKDIGYDEGVGISPMAVSQPFQLFSPKAVQNFRNEILSPKVLEKYSCQSNIAASHLRGFVAE